MVLGLEVSGEAPGAIKVYGAAPQNRGTTRGRDFKVLCRLPPPRNGVSDITQWYVQRYGVPEPGKRVFIRTVVEVNGRQSSPRDTNCVVPERPRLTGRQRKRGVLWTAQDV